VSGSQGEQVTGSAGTRRPLTGPHYGSHPGPVVTQVDVAVAAEPFDALVDRAADGEDIVITTSGAPRVRLVPVAAPRALRKFGRLKGQIWYGPDFEKDLTDQFEDL
jgi:prevent-host-death family protein